MKFQEGYDISMLSLLCTFCIVILEQMAIIAFHYIVLAVNNLILIEITCCVVYC